MKKYHQIRFPVIKILLTAIVFFVIGIFSSTFVIIFITPHKKQILVPDLVGNNYTEALRILKKQDLKSKLIFKYNNAVAKNHVISQLPSPRKQVRIGRYIELNISKGPTFIEVPDITNLTLLNAKNILNRAGKGNIRGLNIGEVTYVHSAYVEANTIIAHNPTYGKKIPKNSPVNVLVSLGPEKPTFFMPNLAGLELKEAIYSLKNTGLILKKIEYKIDKDIKNDIVLEHTPCASTQVSRKDLVTLVVNIKENKETLKPHHAFIHYKVPEGFYNYQVKIFINDEQGKREVFNQKKVPGSKIEFIVPIIGDAKAIIYLNDTLKEEKQL
ncbi:MAG: PASTA domain-containing protein [bacterium]|nr:PASTA domain-containing protein [bacterium]